MTLLTDDLKAQLLANGECARTARTLKPLVKFFDPCGAATWLIVSMERDEDTLFGLCDLGMGFPELGYVSLRELQSVKGPLGIGLERDLWFTPEKTLEAYAEEARAARHIVA